MADSFLDKLVKQAAWEGAKKTVQPAPTVPALQPVVTTSTTTQTPMQTTSPSSQTTTTGKTTSSISLSPLSPIRAVSPLRAYVGEMFAIRDTDRERSTSMQNDFQVKLNDSTNDFYMPYLQPTNKAISRLAAYGVDTSVIDDKFYQDNIGLNKYLIYGGQTNAPSAPSKKTGTVDQFKAYEFNAIGKQNGLTKEALSEYEKLGKEVDFLTNWDEMNFSDDEVWDLVYKDFDKKYPTLSKMDKSVEPGGTLLELNSPVPYSKNAQTVYGMIWGARNKDDSDNYWKNLAGSVNGFGNQYKENPEITAKKNFKDLSTYAPYSLGMTIPEVGVYFGVKQLDEKTLLEIRGTIDPTNAMDVDMFNKGVEAEQRVQRIEKKLTALHEDIDTLAPYYSDPQELIDMIKDDSSYNELFALDESMYTGKLVATSRPINYRWADIEKEIREKCAVSSADYGNNYKTTDKYKSSLTDDYVSGTSPNERNSENYLAKGIEDKHEELLNRELQKIGKTIYAKGSETDKQVFTSQAGVGYERSVGEVGDMVPAHEKALSLVTTDLQKQAVNSYLPSLRTIREYEGMQGERDAKADELHKTNLEITSLEARTRATGGVSVEDRILIGELEDEGTASTISGLIQSNNENDKYLGYRALYNSTIGQHDDNAYENAWSQMFGRNSNAGSVDEFVNANPKLQHYADLLVNGIPENPSQVSEPLTIAEENYLNSLYENRDMLSETVSQYDAALSQGKETYDNAVEARDYVLHSYAEAKKVYGDEVSDDLIKEIDLLDQCRDTWTPYHHSSYSVYQSMEKEEGSPEEVVKKAAETAILQKQMLDKLKGVVQHLDELGVYMSDQDRSNVDQKITVLQKEYDESINYIITKSDEFKGIAEAGKQMSTDDLSYVTRMNVEALRDGKISRDSLGAFDSQFLQGPRIEDSMGIATKNYIEKVIGAMEPEEKDLYFYYLNEAGEDEANRYLESLVNPINGTVMHRLQEQQSKATREETTKDGTSMFLGLVKSFGTNLIGQVQDWVNTRYYEAKGIKNYDPNGVAYSYGNTTDAIRGAIQDEITEQVGGENAEVINFLINAMTSAGDSTASMLLTNGALSVLGKAVPVVQKVMNFANSAANGTLGSKLAHFGAKVASDWAHAVPMAVYAADKSYREAITNDASPEQAQKMWNATFWAESVSEAITVGNINDMWQRGASGDVKNFFGELFKNGFEEAVGEGFNQYWEDNAERAIMGQMSSYNQMVESLVAAHVPRSEAEKMANQQMAKNIMLAAASGFVSSMGSSTLGYIGGQVKGNALNEALDSMTQSDFAKLTEAAASNEVSGAVAIGAVLKNSSFEKMNVIQAKNNTIAAGASAVKIVSDISGGSRSNAIDTMRGIVSAAGRNVLEAKEAVKYGSMTSGETNRTLRRISDAVKTGDQVTDADVNDLVTAMKNDQSGPQAKDLSIEYNKAMTDYRVSVKKMQALAGENIAPLEGEGQRALEAAKKKVADAEKTVSEAQEKATDKRQKKEEADNAVKSIARNAKSAAIQQADAPTKAGNAPIQQHINQMSAAMDNQQRAETEQQQAEVELADAKKILEQSNAELNDKATQVAQEAVAAEIAQDQATEAQMEQDEFTTAVQTYKPTKQFDQPISVKLKDAPGVAKLTGVFALKPNAEIVYTTTDGYISDSALDFEEGLPNEAQQVLDKAMQNWTKKQNPIKPSWWLDRGYKASLIGNPSQTVDIVGIAGQQEEGAMPILMDSNGNVYDTSEIKMEGADSLAIFDALEDAMGKTALPEITPSDVFRLQHPDAGLNETFQLLPEDVNPEAVPDMYENADAEGPAEPVNIIGAMKDQNGATKLVLADGTQVDPIHYDTDFSLAKWLSSEFEQAAQADVTATETTAPEATVQETTAPEATTQETTAPEVTTQETTPQETEQTAPQETQEPTGPYTPEYVTLHDPEGNAVENVLKAPKPVYDAGVGLNIVGLQTSESGKVYYVYEDGTPLVFMPEDLGESDVEFLQWLATTAPEILANPEQGTPAMEDSIDEIREDAVFKLEELGIPLAQPAAPTITPVDVNAPEVTPVDVNEEAPTTAHVNPETGEPLKSWQNPKYHGKEYKPKPKWNPKSKAFRKFLGYDNLPDNAKKFVLDDQGKPIPYYRAWGPSSTNDGVLYTHFKKDIGVTKPNGDKAYANFFGSDFDMVTTYGQGSHNYSPKKVTKLRFIKNWETAKAAMQDIGYDLVEAQDPNGSGKWGYQVMRIMDDGSQIPAIGHHPVNSSTWFAENQLGLFRETYGGGLKTQGIHAGFIAMQNPLVIDAQGKSYASVKGDVTAPDGAHLAGKFTSDDWAAWAFEHGFDTLILENVRDNVSGGGDPMTDIITSSSDQFKSVYNNGEWNRNNPDALALKVKRNGTQAKQTPTKKQASKTKTKLNSPQQIAKSFFRSIGLGEYLGSNNFGNMPKAVRGYYARHADLAAVKDREIGDYTVTMHEGGHAIAARLGITASQQMVNNLLAEEPAFADSYSPNELKDEAFAEFFWRYMEGDERARDFAGDSYMGFFERSLNKDPDLAREVKNARNQLQEYLNADLNEQLEARVRYENNGAKLPFIKQVKRFIAQKADSTSIADEVDAFIGENTGKRGKLRMQALFANHSQKRALVNLTDSLTDANGSRIGDGMYTRIKETGFETSEQNIHELEKYMLLLHSIDREKQKKPVFYGMDMSGRDAEIARLEKTIPHIKEAAAAFQSFRHDFLQAWMVDTGYWTQDLLDTFDKMYPNYVPTFRVRGSMEDSEATGFGKSSKKYTLKEAVGGSEDIYSPMFSFIGMVDQITTMVANNQMAQLFDEYYQDNEGMGVFGRQIPGEEDAALDPSGDLQTQLTNLLETEIPEDLMEQVLEAAKGHRALSPSQGKNLLTVQREDGTSVKYEIDNPDLFKLLTGVQGSTGIRSMQMVGSFTRMMSMLTTGSNPLFAMRNAVRDYQTSVNYGSWASTYLTGAWKWVSAIADIVRNSSQYQDYQALGGGGWTYIQQSNAKNMKQLTNEIFGDDKSTVGKTAKWFGKKVVDLVTMERVNEIIEQASRFVEYKYGKHDKSTPEGRMEAFQAAQDVTVDFSRTGNDEVAYILKKVVPFFNASLQGVYRTGRMFTEAERGRLGVRLAKTAINTALTSAIAAGLVFRYGDDEDKEEYMMLSDGIKANHLVIPNPLKGEAGQAPFLRIPLAQDPFTYGIHNLVTNALAKGSSDEMAISLAATADVILDNLTPVGGTIFQPFLDVSHNKTWYGSNIVRKAQQDWVDKSSQYNEDTPEVFKFLGRLFQQSPEVIEYLATQYTGFIGAMGIPALSIEKDGSLGGFDAVANAAIKKWTADPMTSNDFTNSFYDKKAVLDTIIDETKSDRPLNLLHPSLTQDQVNAAYEEAVALVSSEGIVYKASKTITEAYKEIDRINADPSLTDNEKYKRTRDVRLDMLGTVQAANEVLQTYYKKYIQGETLVDRFLGSIQRIFEEGKRAHIKTPVEKLPETFSVDMDKPYMQKAMEVYSATNSTAALPHPSQTISVQNRKKISDDYTITEDEWPRYTEIYKIAYDKYLGTNKDARKWNTLDMDKKKQILTNAHSAGNDAMRDMYKREHPDIEKNTTGKRGRGNIDLNSRDVVHNTDGTISTEESFSFADEETGKEVLIPRIIKGKLVSEQEAIDHYRQTGQYLGMFDTVAEAERYAVQLHERQDWYYNR